MIKNIKRVGISFLAVAIICLMVIGCVSVNSVASNGNVGDLSNEKSNSAISNTELNSNAVADTELVPDIILKADSNGTLETKWNSAIDLSKAENREVKVRLDQDWEADLIVGRTSFGNGVGFRNGGLYVPTGANLKLDLNGYTIDRRLGTKVLDGSVIYIHGTFTLLDSKFDIQAAYDLYNNSSTKDVDFRMVSSGKITGGYNSYHGGGIIVENATFTMESGMVCNNTSREKAGGIYIIRSTVNIYNSVICENSSYCDTENGAGIYVCNDSVMNMNKGIVYKNFAKGVNADGAGIDVNGNNIEANISNVIISKNKLVHPAYIANGSGGGLGVFGDTNIVANVSNCIFEYNTSTSKGGAISIWTGAVLNMTDSYVSNNTARYGGGININSSKATVNLKNTTITNNYAESAGGIYITAADSYLSVGANVQIYDNKKLNSQEDNVEVRNSAKIIVNEKSTNSKIGIHTYNSSVYTTGYSAHNGSTDPNNYFFSDLSGEIVHLNSAGELEQAKTIASSKYDYIYLENNVRKSYKENGLIHGNNDFDKKQSYNGGKLILGKVSANTSVNQFISNINFGSAVISLLNAKGEIVYGKDADSKFADKLNNASEYAVGTGWKLKVYTTAGDLIDEISISVLGDLTGDGKVNSADVNYLRQVANNGIESLSAEQKLSALIVNKGKLLSNADTETLWNVVCGKMDIESFI